jgi:uncharacterized protein
MPADPPPPRHFLVMAVALEASLAVAAVGLGWLLGYAPAATARWSLAAVGWGALAALPALAVFWFCVRSPIGPLREITRVVDEQLVPLFCGSTLLDLAAISVVAGVGEELLFRGLIQGGVADWIGPPRGVWVGLAAGSILFGLVHPITRGYAVLAGLIGLYLGGLWLALGNLLVPITTHATYDFTALVYLVRLRRQSSD